MKLSTFEYACPDTLSEAIALLASHDGDAKALAGGQSLIPMMAYRVAQPSLLVDLGKITDLKGIHISNYGTRLGALTRWRDIQDDKALSKAQPLLVAAIAHVAHYQIRNRGTVGGSMAHADPAAEMPGVAVTCDAEIFVMGKSGTRTIKAADFFIGPLTTRLQPEEIITEVKLPPWPAERRYCFKEFARRRGDFAISGVALFYDLGSGGEATNTHVGVIGVGGFARRLPSVEATINGNPIDEATMAKASAAASAAVEPNDDIHASAAYRKALTGTLIGRALKSATA
jgi:aerobic carbon-monoxide dehydrogenase medium subunit